MTRLIGIDYDGTTLRLVVLQTDKGRQRLLRHARIAWDGTAPLAALLLDRLGALPTESDRTAIALPPATGLTRVLSFPFSDRRKIEAAVPLELAAQLPIAVDDCIIDHQEPVPVAVGVEVTAAAVPERAVAAATTPLEAAGIPLSTVELFPSALAAGLSAELGDGLFLCLTSGWGTILLLAEGRLCDYRVLPLAEPIIAEVAAAQLLAELRPLLRRGGTTPLRIFGSEASDARLAALQSVLPDTNRIDTLACGDELLAGDLLPALALARRAGVSGRRDGFNFRRGAVRHGEWEAIKSRLLFLGGVVTLALIILALSAGLRWWSKAGEAEGLKKELVKIYREAVPGDGSVVDVNLQLRARLAELTRTSRPGGQHPALAPLALLQEISTRTPADLAVTFRELTVTADEVRIEAFTPTFDAANRLATALSASPLFKRAQLADSKTSADNSRVDFRLVLTLQAAEELP